jgi:hypothetical protein
MVYRSGWPSVASLSNASGDNSARVFRAILYIPARPGAKVRAAMRADPERYVKTVSQFRGLFFAAQEEIKEECEQEGR